MEYRDDAAITKAKLLELADGCDLDVARMAANPAEPNLWPRDLPAPGPTRFVVIGGGFWALAILAAAALATRPDAGGELWRFGGWAVAGLSLCAIGYVGAYRAVLAPLSLVSVSPLLVLRPWQAARVFFADGNEHYLGPAGMFAILSPIIAGLIVAPATVYGSRAKHPDAIRADTLEDALDDLAANVSPKAPASLADALARARASYAALRDAVARDEVARTRPRKARICRAVAIAAVAPVAFVVFAHRRAWSRATRLDADLVLAASLVSLAYVLLVAVLAWRRRPPGSKNT